MIVQDGILAALVSEPEVRGVNGLLRNPPLLFVRVTNEEGGYYRFVQIEWGVLRTLAPHLADSFGKKLMRERTPD